MTYTPIQLEVIKVFGRKELSDYCLVKVDGKYIFRRDTSILEIHYEILGHIPEIFPDVAIVAEERGWLLEIKFGLLTIHFKDRTFTSCKYNTILPLLEQPESVLIELINLFK